MRTRDPGAGEITAVLAAQPRWHQPPPPGPPDGADLWRARREQAWAVAGWLAAAVLTVVLIVMVLVAAHVAPSLLGAR